MEDAAFATRGRGRDLKGHLFFLPELHHQGDRRDSDEWRSFSSFKFLGYDGGNRSNCLQRPGVQVQNTNREGLLYRITNYMVSHSHNIRDQPFRYIAGFYRAVYFILCHLY